MQYGTIRKLKLKSTTKWKERKKINKLKIKSGSTQKKKKDKYGEINARERKQKQLVKPTIKNVTQNKQIENKIVKTNKKKREEERKREKIENYIE